VKYALLLCLAAGQALAAPSAHLKVKDPTGRELFTIKLMDDGAKLVDPADHELARLKRRDDRVKIVGPGDVVLGNLSGGAEKISVKSDDKNVLFVLRRKPDGDYALEDGREATIYKLKIKGPDYLRVEDAGGTTLFKAKRKDGKASVRDGADRELFSADGSPSLVGFAVLALDRLTPPQRAALYYRLDALGVP
jgi:hypothetical protein